MEAETYATELKDSDAKVEIDKIKEIEDLDKQKQVVDELFPT